MLGQLFYNLLENSVRHGKKVSKIKLSFLEDAFGTKITYEDNGVGIAVENKVRIFDGYTTGGSGLGLKLIKKMIETYGWSIEETGVNGCGAKFEITVKGSGNLALSAVRKEGQLTHNSALH